MPSLLVDRSSDDREEGFFEGDRLRVGGARAAPPRWARAHGVVFSPRATTRPRPALLDRDPPLLPRARLGRRRGARSGAAALSQVPLPLLSPRRSPRPVRR